MALFAAALALAGLPLRAQAPAGVLHAMKRAADWQLSHSSRDARAVANSWIYAPFYMGLLELAKVSGDPRYRQAVYEAMDSEGWRLDGGRGEKRAASKGRLEYHADDHAIGQVYLDYYLSEPAATRDAAWIAPTRARLDGILAHPSQASLEISRPGSQERWSWCDALFMGPPTWARLARATGERKYLDFADAEYWETVDCLFDQQASLFFRDSRFFQKKTEPGGEKTFWSRGNGWVYAGLARLIGELPPDHPSRDRYIELFRGMSAALLKVQQPSGAWYPSLLDPLQNGKDESSGTAFFTFGMAWGINHGLLPAAPYREAALRGWKSLTGMQLPDGKLGSVQAVADQPMKPFDRNSSVPYGVGGFLLAGCEILRMLEKSPPR